MATSNQRKWAVRVTYRDGSSAVFGPVSSREEVRRLAERVGGTNTTARIFRWTSSEEGVGGVISRRPAPTEPAPAPEPAAPVILNVTQDPGEDVVVTGTDLDLMEAVHFLPQGGFITNANSSYTLVSPTEVRLGLAVMGTRPFTIEHMNPTTIANPGTSAVGAWDGICLVEDLVPFGDPDFSSPEVDGFLIANGTDLDTVTRIRLYWDNDAQSTFIDPLYTEQDSVHILIGTGYGMGLDGETISKVELWTGSFPGTLAATYPGLSVEIQAAPAQILSVSYDFGNDEVTIVGSGFDMNDVAQIDWEGNSSIPPQQGAEVSGSLTQAGVDWTVSDPSTLVIPSNTVAGLGSGSFSSLIFYDSLSQELVSWTGYEEFV